MSIDRRRGGVARIALNRPDKRKLIAGEMMAALRDALLGLRGRPSVRVLLVALARARTAQASIW